MLTMWRCRYEITIGTRYQVNILLVPLHACKIKLGVPDPSFYLVGVLMTSTSVWKVSGMTLVSVILKIYLIIQFRNCVADHAVYLHTVEF